jgi:hypothetical protein
MKFKKQEQVTVRSGRNKGQVGTIISKIRGTTGKKLFLIDFNRNIMIDEGFGSINEYPDTYWVAKKNLEKIQVST